MCGYASPGSGSLGEIDPLCLSPRAEQLLLESRLLRGALPLRGLSVLGRAEDQEANLGIAHDAPEHLFIPSGHLADRGGIEEVGAVGPLHAERPRGLIDPEREIVP